MARLLPFKGKKVQKLITLLFRGLIPVTLLQKTQLFLGAIDELVFDFQVSKKARTIH